VDRVKDPDRVTTGRIGAYRLHGLYDSKKLTTNARAGFLGRFRDEARAAAEARGEQLDEKELERRAISLRKSYMQRLAREREKRRAARKAKSSSAPPSTPELEEDRRGTADAPSAA
jgi:hypothetical protein